MNSREEAEAKLTQSEIFLLTEADHWYLRNKSRLSLDSVKSTTEKILEVCNPFKDEINSILEVGCSSAHKLEHLVSQLESVGYGLDPSPTAINEAKTRFEIANLKSEFHVGIASELPFSESQMDLIFMGFCLYLVDREKLNSVIAEADRVLRPGGFLVIEDFDYGVPVRRRYSHFEGVLSFKDDYSKFFEENFKYHLISKFSYSHNTNTFSKDRNERVALHIMYKPLD